MKLMPNLSICLAAMLLSVPLAHAQNFPNTGSFRWERAWRKFPSRSTSVRTMPP